jgi:hypothetical protein
MALLKQDNYRPLENEDILDASGQTDAIEAKYGKCFDGSDKIGDMLANKEVVRDTSGDVIDSKDALCSPMNLSSDSNEFGAQMVFRWRVAHNYDNTITHLTDQQDVSASAPPASAAGSATALSTSPVSNDAQAVAKEILANNNIDYIFSAKEDVTLASEGKNGTNGAPIDIRALQIVAALGKKHKLIVSAYESHGQGHHAGSDHYSGHAVDIANIDGALAFTNITDFWPEFKDYASGAVFLQGDCPGAKAAPAGMNRQPGDTCNHQHISFN